MGTFVALIVLLLIIGVLGIPKPDTTYYRLKRDLLTNYDPTLRPVENPNTVTKVTVSMYLYELLSVIEANNVVQLSGLLEFYWEDEYLGWDPAEYDNVQEIPVSAKDIWTPSLDLWNSSSIAPSVSKDGAVTLVHTGECEYQIPFFFNILCPINVKYFPWDHQNCTFSYGLTNRYNSDILLVSKYSYADLNFTVPHPEWSLLGGTAEGMVVPVPDRPADNYTFIEFSVEIERRPLFFMYTLVLPSSMIAVIAIISFFNPMNNNNVRQEKCRLGISAFTSMLVLQLNVMQKLPKSATIVPILGIYFSALLVLIFAGIVTGTTIIALDLEVRRVPACLRSLFCEKLIKILPFTIHVKPKSDTLTVDKVLNTYVKKELARQKSAAGRKSSQLLQAKMNGTFTAVPATVDNGHAALAGADLQTVERRGGKLHIRIAPQRPFVGVDLDVRKGLTYANPWPSSPLENVVVIEEFAGAVRGIVGRWGDVVGTVEGDLAKEKGRAEWKTFINVLERLAMFFFLFLWCLIMIFFLAWHGWY